MSTGYFAKCGMYLTCQGTLLLRCVRYNYLAMHACGLADLVNWLAGVGQLRAPLPPHHHHADATRRTAA